MKMAGDGKWRVFTVGKKAYNRIPTSIYKNMHRVHRFSNLVEKLAFC